MLVGMVESRRIRVKMGKGKWGMEGIGLEKRD